MTARVEREFTVDASPEAVWEFISDPGNRARAISVVDRFETHGDTATWHIALPIPLVSKTVRVRTKTVTLEAPDYVRFEGNSSVFDVLGEHRMSAADGTTTITNTFTVDGHVPGVETFFERHLDGEIDNLEAALRTHLEAG